MASKSILLDGHGEWNPSSVPAYALVPKKSRLLFFTENMKLFVASRAAKSKLMSTMPNQVVEGFNWAQNYTVSGGIGIPMNIDGVIYKSPTVDMLLCTSDECGKSGWHKPGVCNGLFADPDFEDADIYFVACRFVNLKETGDLNYYIETGLNQRQAQLGDQGDFEVDTALSNDKADELGDSFLEDLFDDRQDYIDLDADEKADVRAYILSTVKDDYRPAAQRAVDRLKARFG